MQGSSGSTETGIFFVCLCVRWEITRMRSGSDERTSSPVSPVSCIGNGPCGGESCNGARSDVMPMAANGCQWLPMVANGLPMVAIGCQWLPFVGRNQYSHVTSKSINNPVSSRRKCKLSPKNHHPHHSCHLALLYVIITYIRQSYHENRFSESLTIQ
jgi:hypothetical protein